MMTADVGSQVGHLVLRIGEGVRTRVIFDPKIRSVLRRMFQADDRLELQNPGALRKVDQRHAVSENVVDPANLGRIRRHLKTRLEQALIEAIAGSEQHLMPARPYRLLVPIRGRVMDAENSHGGIGPVPESISRKATCEAHFYPSNESGPGMPCELLAVYLLLF